jgi:nucleoside-diphosphate-sugar epimerase
VSPITSLFDSNVREEAPTPPTAGPLECQNPRMKIAVTGGSGKAGRAIVRDLLEHGHEVLNVDRVPSAESSSPDSPAPFLAADLTDFGQALEAISGAERLPGIEAVVHLAAIPSPMHATPDTVFRTNIVSTHTVFAAAARLGLKRVVWASSETTLGLPFDTPPDYAPVDEELPLRPESSYALSKVLGEEMARQFSRWSGIPFVGLRFSNVMERADYARFPSFWDDPHARKWNLWGYVDESHVAQSVRCALAADVRGAEAFIVAAADTVMQTPSRELMAEVFPSVPIRGDVAGHETLLSIEKARRLLGYEPTFTWREIV